MVETGGVEKRIAWVSSRLMFQQLNGLVTKDQAVGIATKLNDAEVKLSATQQNLPGADQDARQAQILLTDAINSSTNGWARRFAYLYGGLVWIIVGGTALCLIGLLISDALDFSLFTLQSGTLTVPISAEVIVWGGLGGCAFSIYYLRKNVYELQLSKFYSVYYIVYPLAGALFGTAIVLIMAGGLLAVDATPGYALFAAVAFLGGLLQEWAIGVFQDIAEAIHKTRQ